MEGSLLLGATPGILGPSVPRGPWTSLGGMVTCFLIVPTERDPRAPTSCRTWSLVSEATLHITIALHPQPVALHRGTRMDTALPEGVVA